MTATDRLDQIQARADAATEGVWEAHGLDSPISLPNVRVRRQSLQEGVAYKVMRGRDADFIAAARQDVPDLVAALRAVLAVADDYAEDAQLHRVDADRFYDPSEPRSHRLVKAREADEHARRIRDAVESALGGAR